MNDDEVVKIEKVVVDYINRNLLLFDQKKYLLSLIDDLLSSLYSFDIFNNKLFMLPYEFHKIIPAIGDSEDISKSNVTDILKLFKENVLSIEECEVLVSQMLHIDDQLNIASNISRTVGRTVAVKFNVDSALIAGVVIRIDGKVYDYSFASYL